MGLVSVPPADKSMSKDLKLRGLLEEDGSALHACIGEISRHLSRSVTLQFITSN